MVSFDLILKSILVVCHLSTPLSDVLVGIIAVPLEGLKLIREKESHCLKGQCDFVWILWVICGILALRWKGRILNFNPLPSWTQCVSNKETWEGSSVSHHFFDYSGFDINLQSFISMDISVSAECADMSGGVDIWWWMNGTWQMMNTWRTQMDKRKNEQHICIYLTVQYSQTAWN